MKPLPSVIKPMKAVAGPLPTDEGWAYEIKWDGMRIVSFLDTNAPPAERVRLQSANLNDATDSFPELAALADALGARQAILDGEVVAFDDGRPDFATLQRRMHVKDRREAMARSQEVPVTYVVFDLLHLDGIDTTGLVYADRRALLTELAVEGDWWQTATSHIDDGEARFAAVRDAGLEGLIAKRVDSIYVPGARSRSWRKVKVRHRQELVVGGWTPGDGHRVDTIGALLVGYWQNEHLVFAGRVGTGFDDTELQRLRRRLAQLERLSSPFDGPLDPDTTRRAR